MALIKLIISLILLQFHSTKAHNSNKTTIVPAIIVFGDSIVDPGNNNVLFTVVKSNFPPYGRDFINHMPTGRFSNGKISMDFLASKLGVKEYIPAFLGTQLSPQDLITGVSFASAGTGYDPLTATVASVIPLPQQLEYFKQYKKRLEGILREKMEQHLLESLFIVCSGSNDVVEYFSNPMEQHARDMNSQAKYLVQIASRFLQDLASQGARKVGVVEIPPVGCMPSQRVLAGGIFTECADGSNQFAQTYNEKLIMEIKRLNSILKGKKIFYIDVYSILFNIIQHPSTYGFQVSERGCCGTGTLEVAVLCNALTTTCRNASEYIFWDSYHPTERANEVLVEQLVQKYISFIK